LAWNSTERCGTAEWIDCLQSLRTIVPSKNANFQADFADLRRALNRERRLPRGGVVMTPERMIVELRLTPKKVATLEAEYGISLPWFAPAYAALKRHSLFPRRKLAWGKWLKLYQAKRQAAGR
jgi:hypothetical protein